MEGTTSSRKSDALTIITLVWRLILHDAYNRQYLMVHLSSPKRFLRIALCVRLRLRYKLRLGFGHGAAKSYAEHNEGLCA